MMIQIAHVQKNVDLSKAMANRIKVLVGSMLRLKKLKEAKDSMDPQLYLEKVQEAHADLMRLGQFWKGREQEVFGGTYQPSELIEPLPGSPDDR